ncbi:hypothetical protein H0H93_005347, partial [Arthromyces matolae]
MSLQPKLVPSSKGVGIDTIILAPREAALFIRDKVLLLCRILEHSGYTGQVSFSPGLRCKLLGRGLVRECILLRYPQGNIKRKCAKAMVAAMGPTLSLVIVGKDSTTIFGEDNYKSFVSLERLIIKEHSKRTTERSDDQAPVFTNDDYETSDEQKVVSHDGRDGNKARSSGTVGSSGDTHNDGGGDARWPPFSRTSSKLLFHAYRKGKPRGRVATFARISSQMYDIHQFVETINESSEKTCCDRLKEGVSTIIMALPSSSWWMSKGWGSWDVRYPKYEEQLNHRQKWVINLHCTRKNLSGTTLTDYSPYDLFDGRTHFHEQTEEDLRRTGRLPSAKEWFFIPTLQNENLENCRHGFFPPNTQTPLICHRSHSNTGKQVKTACDKAFSLRCITEWTLDSEARGPEELENDHDEVTFIQVTSFVVKISELCSRRCNEINIYEPYIMSPTDANSYPGDGSPPKPTLLDDFDPRSVARMNFLNCDDTHGQLLVKGQRTYCDPMTTFEAVVLQLNPRRPNFIQK